MPRTSIQQFRAALTDGADQSPLMRAYRRIANVPASVAAMAGGEWVTWPPALAAAGEWIPWGAQPAASERQAGPRFAAWGDWSTPPAAAA
ncbi:MAG: hypothetical protein ACJ8J0_16070 [Longimicrobiaceae bacterium]